MMQPGSLVPGLLPPASPRLYRSVCLAACLSICPSVCPSICMSGCKSIQADAAVCLSLHSMSLSVRPVRLSVYLSICLSICLPISLCLPMYLSVRLPICPAVYLPACPRERWGIPGIPYRDGTTVPRAARCGVSPSADVPGMIGS